MRHTMMALTVGRFAMQAIQNRRHFLAGLSSAAVAGLYAGATPALAEPPPEVTRVRMAVYPKVADCATPFYVADELLRAEGFTEIEFIQPASDAEGLRLLPKGK